MSTDEMTLQQTEGIIIKPQFDTKVFTAKTAIVFKQKHERGITNALVLEATPLYLRVVFVDQEHGTDFMTIKIEEVVGNMISIEILKRG